MLLSWGASYFISTCLRPAILENKPTQSWSKLGTNAKHNPMCQRQIRMWTGIGSCQLGPQLQVPVRPRTQASLTNSLCKGLHQFGYCNFMDKTTAWTLQVPSQSKDLIDMIDGSSGPLVIEPIPLQATIWGQ